MKKSRVIFLLIFFILFIILITYLNYDKIFSFFANKEWEIADSIGKIELEDGYLETIGTSSNFIVIGTSYIKGYSQTIKQNINESKTLKDIVTYSDGDYCILAEKNPANITVLCGNKIVWENTINNVNIYGVYINKNGYSAVIYSQTGYKSLIRVFSNTGEELFTNYLASTYAIDVAISNDNKMLAIGEIDTDGINVESKVKLINIKEASENKVESLELDSNELITDIEYTDNGNILIMTDTNIKLLKNNEFIKILNFKEEGILSANISNKKNAITVKQEKNGLFNSKYKICIYNENDTKTYDLKDAPNYIKCLKNVIAVDMGNEIIFLNSSGNFLKKCSYKGQLKDITLFNDGNTAVLIFRDTAEFIKVGGM